MAYQWLLWIWGILWLFSLVPSVHANEIITLGQRNWDGSRAITHILKNIIETRLGYHARIVESDDPGIFAAMHEGKGRIDVLTDLWKLNQADQWAKYVEGYKSVIVNDKPYFGRQGLFIPKYFQVKHKVYSVYDLVNPKIAKLLDSDGDGKGEYWSSAYGWSSTHVEQVKAKSYGYDKYFKPHIISDRAFKAKLETAYKEEKVFYFTTGHRNGSTKSMNCDS
ncbi:MAG: hypothetical protein ETSY2_45120 [Candidatus Entotheonella gemina]|uniref:ABC-type glycine betaine transport system substrate-binding domain-containing protein n=1 Tax=Candidatus Entotheonella gemina TaxID=1429439 RepID=W4LGC9_9BACT|nr:MAG: hypothetical protein ETSY2_45120 [Candidatus Entotheonella gemina]